MTKSEYLEHLDSAFKDFIFYPEDHHYEFKGKRVGISVTSLISKYENEFEAEAVAERVAIRDNKTIQEVLKEWEQKGEYACTKGSICHEFAQSLWKTDEPFVMLSKNLMDYNLSGDDNISKIVAQASDFYSDYKEKFEHIADEYIVGSEEYDIASAIDHLFINRATEGLILVDYKTNSDIHKNEKYAKKMKVPLSHLKDTTLNHYAIQLSIYRYLVEKYANLEVEDMFIVWLSELNEKYEIIEVPYLKEEVRELLENRRVKNMNGMGVLIMGASGSGKSTSLRNLPAEETAIINITNKPMPFKNDGKLIATPKDFYKEEEKGEIVYEELYKRIIATIKATKKRIIVIDDSSYLMSFENFEKANNKGYDKFTTMAKNYYDLIKTAISCDNEKIVYVITHEEVDDVNQLYRPKTIGKMLSNQLVVEGLFSIVLRSQYKNGEYIFQTQGDGTSVCKSPMGMFESKEMPNDLYEVDKIIREYYGFKKIEDSEKGGEE